MAARELIQKDIAQRLTTMKTIKKGNTLKDFKSGNVLVPISMTLILLHC